MKRVKRFISVIKNRKRDGYFTIEATLVFSALFFSLMLILFMGMVLYQEVNLQSLAVRASERGSVVYSSRVSDMRTGEKTLEDFKYRDPYRNVPLINMASDGSYQNLVQQYVNQYLGENNVLAGERGSGSVTIENYVIAKRIKVNIQNSYQMPVDAIGKMFDHEGPFDVNTSAVSAVVDPVDFARNVDLVTDILKQTSIFDKVEDAYGKIQEALEKLSDLLK